MIHSSALPVGACPELLHKTLDLTTIEGTYKANRRVYLEDITLPEFDKTRRIDGVWVYVFDTPCQHDIILGQDFLHKAGIAIDFEFKFVKWLDKRIDMKSQGFLQNDANVSLLLDAIAEDEDLGACYEEIFSTMISDSNYKKHNVDNIANQQLHLTAVERAKLKQLLSRYDTLFDGKLGQYRGHKNNLKIDKNAKPYQGKAYAVPHAHKEPFIKELKCLVEIRVLHICRGTEWAAPTFIIPK